MLSQKMMDALDAGKFDLAVVHGVKADWNPKMDQFENMRGFTVNWGSEIAADLEDKDVQLYKQINIESS